MSKAAVAALALALALAAVACSTAGGGGANGSPGSASPAFDYPETVLGPKRNGLNGWVLLGEEVSVRLPVEKSAGQDLRMIQEPDPEVLEPTMRMFVPSGQPDIGHEVWRYRGVAIGETEVAVEYLVEANGKRDVTDVYTVTIHVWDE